jgi:uncharacterized protein YecA (UPF0149 family)
LDGATPELINNGLWTVFGVLVFVVIFISLMVRGLRKRTKNTIQYKKKAVQQSTKERNYREWKISGLNSRKGIYIKDKNMCPCGSGLQYKDCCGR